MFNYFGSLMNAGSTVDAADAVRQVAAGKAIVIDVREAGEIRASGKAKGALNLPLSTLHETSDPKSARYDKRLAKARKSGQPIYLYCASGARSGRAAGMLRTQGFEQVNNLGTLQAWHGGGGAVTR